MRQWLWSVFGGLYINQSCSTIYNNVTLGIYNISGDPFYSVAEKELRGALIQSGPSHSYRGECEKQTVLLVPGTGLSPEWTFATMAKQLREENLDVFMVKIPKDSMDDCQVNAEYVAYSLHHIKERTYCPNTFVVSWSQGSINMQWALHVSSCERLSLYSNS